MEAGSGNDALLTVAYHRCLEVVHACRGNHIAVCSLLLGFGSDLLHIHLLGEITQTQSESIHRVSCKVICNRLGESCLVFVGEHRNHHSVIGMKVRSSRHIGRIGAAGCQTRSIAPLHSHRIRRIAGESICAVGSVESEIARQLPVLRKLKRHTLQGLSCERCTRRLYLEAEE